MRLVPLVGVILGSVLLFSSIVAAGERGGASSAAAVPDPLTYFSREEMARGKAYMQGRYALFFIRQGITLLFLLAFLVTPAGRALRTWALSFTGGRLWLAAVLFVLCFLLLQALITLPLRFYGGYLREKAFGLSTLTAWGWLLDYLKEVGIGTLLTLLIVPVLYTLIQRWPTGWFLPAGLLGSALSILLVALAPIVIDPLFHTFRPLADPDLRARILTLAERAGLSVETVYEADASRRTTKANAYFTGLGRTKRIVVYDTLVRDSSPEEVELVVAHEMGHWRHNHIWKGIALSALAMFAAFAVASIILTGTARRGLFGLTAPSDLAGLPLLLLVLFLLNLLTLPVQSAISRYFERQADLASLLLTEKPEVFIKSEVTLTRSNLSDITPPRPLVLLLYTHPPVLERIALAEAFAKSGNR